MSTCRLMPVLVCFVQTRINQQTNSLSLSFYRWLLVEECVGGIVQKRLEIIQRIPIQQEAYQSKSHTDNDDREEEILQQQFCSRNEIFHDSDGQRDKRTYQIRPKAQGAKDRIRHTIDAIDKRHVALIDRVDRKAQRQQSVNDVA